MSPFRDAGGKTRRQSMLLWAVSTDVVSLDQALIADVVSPESFLIKDWLPFVPSSPWVSCLWGQIWSCVEHTDYIWPTAKHFNCHIWSRWEDDGQENPGILWSVLLLGLKFSRLGHLRTPGLCEKPQETQWLLSYFIGTPTVRNNYDYEM